MPTSCLGLIGGLGPAATVHYYGKLIEAHRALGAVPDLVVAHADAERVLGAVAVGDLDGLAEYLASFARRLHAAGASVLALTGIAPHIAAAELAAISPIPMVDAVVEAAERVGMRRGPWYVDDMARLRGEELLQRIEMLATHAKQEIDVGTPDAIQNAAGKAWAAANLTMSLVIEARTGQHVRGTATRRDRLEELVRINPRLRDFHLAVEKAYSDLHLSCSDDGDCNSKRVRRRVRDVLDVVVPVARAHGA